MSRKSIIGAVMAIGLLVAANSAFAVGPFYGGHMMDPESMTGPGTGQGHWATGHGDDYCWSETASLCAELYEKQVKLDELTSTNPINKAQVKAARKDIDRLTRKLSEKQVADAREIHSGH